MGNLEPPVPPGSAGQKGPELVCDRPSPLQRGLHGESPVHRPLPVLSTGRPHSSTMPQEPQPASSWLVLRPRVSAPRDPHRRSAGATTRADASRPGANTAMPAASARTLIPGWTALAIGPGLWHTAAPHCKGLLPPHQHTRPARPRIPTLHLGCPRTQCFIMLS